MSFQSIRRILPKSIQQAGIKKHVDAVRVIETAERSLLALWGEERASRIQFISFQSGVLKAKSLSPTAVQEFKLMKSKFLNELNRALGEKVVHALNVFHA